MALPTGGDEQAHERHDSSTAPWHHIADDMAQAEAEEDAGYLLETGRPAPSRSRKLAMLALRLAVSGLMLWFLFGKIGGSSNRPELPDWNRSTGFWLAGAALLTLASIVLSALRWQSVLTVLGQPTRLGRLLSHYLAGQFVANVLPTTIGGDALRVSRQTRDSGSGPSAFASVVLERLTGWLVLPIITFLGLLLNPPLRHLGNATQVAFSLAAATLVLLLLVLFAVASRRYGDLSIAATGWRRFLAAVSLGVDQLRRNPRRAASVIAVGFAYQLSLVAAAVMAARALGIEQAGPTALLAFFPAVAIAQVLPISISGLGVRETLFAVFLRPLGVPTKEAVALGILLYLLNLLVSLLGAPAFAVGGRGPDPRSKVQPPVEAESAQ